MKDREKWTYKIMNEKVISPEQRQANQARLAANLSGTKMKYEFLNSQGKVCCKSNDFNSLCIDCKVRARLANGQTVQSDMKLNTNQGEKEMCRCAKCGGIKPKQTSQNQVVVDQRTGHVTLPTQHLLDMAGGSPNLYISLDDKDEKALVTDRNGKPEILNRSEEIPVKSFLLREKSDYQRYLESTSSQHRQTQERFSSVSESDSAPPALSVAERIREKNRKK